MSTGQKIPQIPGGRQLSARQNKHAAAACLFACGSVCVKKAKGGGKSVWSSASVVQRTRKPSFSSFLYLFLSWRRPSPASAQICIQTRPNVAPSLSYIHHGLNRYNVSLAYLIIYKISNNKSSPSSLLVPLTVTTSHQCDTGGGIWRTSELRPWQERRTGMNVSSSLLDSLLTSRVVKEIKITSLSLFCISFSSVDLLLVFGCDAQFA